MPTTTRSRELREKRAKSIEQCRKISDAAAAAPETHQDGKLTADEQRRYDLHWNEAQDLGVIIRREEQLEGEEDGMSETLNPHRAGKEGPVAGPPNGQITRAGNGLAPRRSFTRGEIAILRREERFADYVSSQRGDTVSGGNVAARLSGVVRGMLTGDWRQADEERTMGGGLDVGGGYLLSEATSSTVIDLARNKARLLQAGALTIPLGESATYFAVVTGDLSAQWKQENLPASFSDVTLGRITMMPRTLVALTSMSVELAEDAPNVGEVVETSISEGLALKLDYAGLRGVGAAAEPMGIRFWPDVQTITGVGSPLYDDFSNAVQKVAEANGEATAAILTPRDWGTLDRLKDTTGQPLAAPASYAELKKFTTNQIPTNLGGGAESEAYVGDFRNVWFGIRRRILIEASRTAADATQSAFKNMQVWIRAYLRADVAIAHERHLVVLTGVTT